MSEKASVERGKRKRNFGRQSFYHQRKLTALVKMHFRVLFFNLSTSENVFAPLQSAAVKFHYFHVAGSEQKRFRMQQLRHDDDDDARNDEII